MSRLESISRQHEKEDAEGPYFRVSPNDWRDLLATAEAASLLLDRHEKLFRDALAQLAETLVPLSAVRSPQKGAE